MKIKNINKLLASTLFLSSFNLSSFAGTLSEDGRHETFEGSNIAINDVLEKDKVNINIEGDTLVNLANNISWEGSYRDEKVFSKEGDKYVLDSNTGSAVFTINSVQNLRGKTLTFMFNYEASVIHPQTHVGYYNGRAFNGIQGYEYAPINGFNKVTLKVPDEDCYLLYVGYTGNSDKHIQKISDAMILEGDWSNKKNPVYFEGIKSSFEDNLVTQEMVDSDLEEGKNLGKYKVEIKSTGKNKVDPTNARNSYRLDCDIENDVITLTQNTHDYFGYYAIKLNLKPNTRYVFQGFASGGNNSKMRLYSFETGTDYGFVYNGTVVQTKDDVNGVCLLLYSCFNQLTDAGVTATFSNIQLEEGSVASEYEPFREEIKTFYLNSPLLKGDTIEYINGQATHVRNYKRTVVDETRADIVNQTDFENQDSTIGFNVRGFLGGNASYGLDNSYSDKFICYPQIYLHNNDIEGISQGFSTLYVRISRSKLNSETVEGFREWLKDNPITMIYKLAEPIYEPISTDLSISLEEGMNHIYSNSNIPANIKLTVDRVANRAVEAINAAKINPTIENIAIARMWSNLLKDSILKDDLQSDIDNITEITDLVVEKKKVSANLDLYVKSENALSMSLDTNSVTFDNYNNTEDMEKLGAVNITVSSSLPYDLNAYMSNGISNMDGTKTMDSNLLNIKEDSTTVYKPFVGIDTKVSLKEDCNAGNNNIHTIDFKLNGGQSYDIDIYRTVIKFEAQQK